MSFETWVLYLIAVFVVTMTPGPNILLGMTNCVNHGFKTTVAGAFGAITATTGMAILSASGLGAILLASETLFSALKYVGGAYLFYLGARLFLKKEAAFSHNHNDSIIQKPLRAFYLKGFLVSASNPKGILFFGALFPVFIDPALALLPQFAILMATFMFFSFGSIVFYGGLTGKLSPFLNDPLKGKWFNRISGALFMGVGLALATSKE